MTDLKLEVGKVYLNEKSETVVIEKSAQFISTMSNDTIITFMGITSPNPPGLTSLYYTEKGFGIGRFVRNSGYVEAPPNLKMEVGQKGEEIWMDAGMASSKLTEEGYHVSSIPNRLVCTHLTDKTIPGVSLFIYPQGVLSIEVNRAVGVIKANRLSEGALK